MSQHLPTFLVIGPGRAGTSWMYEALREHPQVGTAWGTKETRFFDVEYSRGVAWYAGFFRHCSSCQAIGEVANTYIYNPLVPPRIKAVLPDVKLVACLRDPLERLQSVYWYRLWKREITTDLEHAIGFWREFIYDNLYWVQLSRYLACFDASQLTILFYDDLVKDPACFLRRLYQAVGVDADFAPSVVHRRINPGVRARHRSASWLAEGTSWWLRKLGCHVILSGLKRSRLVRALAARELSASEKEVIPPWLRKELRIMLQPEIDAVAHFTGRDLSHWMQPPEPSR